MPTAKRSLILATIGAAGFAIGQSAPARADCNPASIDPTCATSILNPTNPASPYYANSPSNPASYNSWSNPLNPYSPYNTTNQNNPDSPYYLGTPAEQREQARHSLACQLGVLCPPPEPAASAAPIDGEPSAPHRPHHRHRRAG